MAKTFVIRNRVMRNGKRVLNMKGFETKEVTYAVEVDTADGGGTGDVPRRYGFTIDYVIPRESAKLDWSDVIDETWVVELEGGRRIIYGGVKCLKRGSIRTDFEKEVVFTLEFRAESETIQ